jgi:hypothetical protein
VIATSRDESDGVESAEAEPEPEPDADAEGYIDGQEEDSFPASDPHSDWSGPPERD